ncbi:MAG: 50S ribosomal protein L11 methyltransferase [Bacteroidota bacterium]
MNYVEVKGKIDPLIQGNDLWISLLAEVGFESFSEDEEFVLAYIQEPDFDENKVTEIAESMKINNFSVAFSSSTIQEKNWNEVWEQSYEPVIVEDKCIIRAPFHQVEGKFEFNIVINPKMSFGTGHHETTYLCTSKICDLDLKDKEVLDMGCGTGVLAIIAAQKGAKRIVAIDNNDWAYENTLENIQINNTPQIETFLGDAELLKDFKPFDVIVANINRNILLADIPKYATSLKKDGLLFMSGFYELDLDAIKKCAINSNLKFEFFKVLNTWTLAMFKK